VNRIHPTAVVDPTVTLGEGNVVGPYALILGDTKIGDNNWIGPHAAIGTPAQMKGGVHPATWEGEPTAGRVVIGSGNVIREFSTVHASTTGLTSIADDCYFMTQAHVPHDATIEDGVTLSNSAQLGGHTIIQSGANIGLGAVIHQRTVVGTRVMVGMGTVVTKDVPPFAMFFGSPGRVRGGNIVGMERGGFNSDTASLIAGALADGDLDRVTQLAPTEMKRYLDAVARLNP
jgi:UDP-N-acetylglucosamine acyltransferase